MPMNPAAKTLALIIIAAFIALSAIRASAATLVFDSIELQVADAELVFRATIDTTRTTYRGTFATCHVIESLKGKTPENIDCRLPEFESITGKSNAEKWKNDKTEILVCLVKDDRAAKDDPVQWKVREYACATGLIPLDNAPGWRAP